MDDTNPDQPNPQGDPETKPSNNAIDQHQVNTHDGAPQDHRPHVAFRNPIVPICGGLVASSRWITEKWGETTFHDKVSIILTSLITLATIAYAIVAGLTLKAINTSSASAGTQNTQLISAAKTQAQAAKTFAQATNDLAESANQDVWLEAEKARVDRGEAVLQIRRIGLFYK